MNGSTAPESGSPHSDIPKHRTAPSILVVDDEPHIRSSLLHALHVLGYTAVEAGSGAEALVMLSTLSFDAMVLDMHMPGMSGMEVMQEVRRQGNDIAIVVLTGHGTLESALSAIRADVAEYLLKPASVAQIHDTLSKALARREREQRAQHFFQTIEQAVQGLQQLELQPAPTEKEGRFLHAGPLLLDQESRTAIYAGEQAFTASLSESEARLLAHLIRHPNQVLSCRQLAGALDYRVEEYEAEILIRPHISRLRQHLGSMPGAAEFIRTVRGRGYIFTPVE